MCGRFTLVQSTDAIAEAFDLEKVPSLEPRYNIAPTQPVATVIQSSSQPRREFQWLHWGLIPHWAKDPSIGNKLINARAETVEEKPSFRDAFRKRRCLIVADGFYEWQAQKGRKQPFYFYLRDLQSDDHADPTSSPDRLPFAFAGLWERWQSESGEGIQSCTILTTQANDLLRSVHDRMPVILKPEDYTLWLDPQVQTSAELKCLLQPYPAESILAYPVSTRVNRPSQEGSDCIQPLEV